MSAKKILFFLVLAVAAIFIARGTYGFMEDVYNLYRVPDGSPGEPKKTEYTWDYRYLGPMGECAVNATWMGESLVDVECSLLDSKLVVKEFGRTDSNGYYRFKYNEAGEFYVQLQYTGYFTIGGSETLRKWAIVWLDPASNDTMVLRFDISPKVWPVEPDIPIEPRGIVVWATVTNEIAIKGSECLNIRNNIYLGSRALR